MFHGAGFVSITNDGHKSSGRCCKTARNALDKQAAQYQPTLNMEDAPVVLKLFEVRMTGHMGPSTTMHVATNLAEYSRASGPYLYNRFHESFRPNKAFGLVVVTAALWRRARLCQTSAKTLQSTNGTVLTDKESDILPIKRETKQGSPLSSLLFNTVLQNSLEEDRKTVARKTEASD